MDLKEMDRFVNNLRCSRCRDYLKCRPIVLQDDGTSVCGHCTPTITARNPDGSAIPQVVLEKVLQKCTFPCKFQSSGCTARVLFDSNNHEEEDCIYSSTPCPVKNCSWKSFTVEMQKHFIEAHGDILKPELEFKVNLQENSNGNVLTIINKIAYLLHYAFNAKRTDLSLKVTCTKNPFYKVLIVKVDDKDCEISIQEENYCSYSTEANTGMKICLSNYLLNSEGPECMQLKFKILPEKKAAEIDFFKSGGGKRDDSSVTVHANIGSAFNANAWPKLGERKRK